MPRAILVHCRFRRHFCPTSGNLVILPFEGEAVWWYEAGRFEQKFFGHHGGLTPGEMETPLLIYALD